MSENTSEEQKPQENKMGVMPVNRLLLTMSLPMMASMLVQALYNIIDSVFVAMISENALSAVSMAFPMQNLLIGLGSGLGVGTNALLSRALGKGDTEGSDDVAMHGVFLSACCYVVFLILGLTVTRPFFMMQGATEEIANYGTTYLTIVMCASFGIYMELIFERLLQSTGKTLYTMFTQGTGAILNIILDPMLIFGIGPFPELGIAGAATATVIGQIVAAIMAIIFNQTKNDEVHLNFSKFKPNLKTIGSIAYIGVPSVIMVAIGSVMNIGVNIILAGFTSTAVAVFGAYFKLQSFAFMPVFGLNNGMVPIIAYNYGAGKADRIKQVTHLGMIYSSAIMIVFIIIIQLFPSQLLLMFSASEEMLSIGIPAMRILSASFLLAGISIIITSYFQALGNGIYSMWMSILRQLVVLLPLAYLFSLTGNLTMVWVAWPAAELVSFFFGLFLYRRINRKVLKPLEDSIAAREANKEKEDEKEEYDSDYDARSLSAD